MGILVASQADVRSSWEPSFEPVRRHWYATYTSAQHERRVANHLAGRCVEHFLPTYPSVRRWKDRKKVLDLPLFPGYIFVRIDLKDRLRVLEIPGVVRLVGFNGLPTALPDEEVNRLGSALEHAGALIRPHPYLVAGRRVRIKSGPLAGIEGILLRRKGNFRFVISIEMIQRSVAVEMAEVDLEPLRN